MYDTNDTRCQLACRNDTAVIMYKSERKPVGAISVKVDHA
jgi:hypothetical protein